MLWLKEFPGVLAPCYAPDVSPPRRPGSAARRTMKSKWIWKWTSAQTKSPSLRKKKSNLYHIPAWTRDTKPPRTRELHSPTIINHLSFSGAKSAACCLSRRPLSTVHQIGRGPTRWFAIVTTARKLDYKGWRFVQSDGHILTCYRIGCRDKPPFLLFFPFLYLGLPNLCFTILLDDPL